MFDSGLLSFDHGASSGYCYCNLGKYKHSGQFEIESLYDAYVKYRDIMVRCEPNLIVIEKVNVAGTKFGGNNVIKLAQYQGVIKLLAEMYRIHVFEVNPMSMKKDLTGNGRAEKWEVANVSSIFSGTPRDIICRPVYYVKGEKAGQIKSYISEESDAIGMALYAIRNYKGV